MKIGLNGLDLKTDTATADLRQWVYTVLMEQGTGHEFFFITNNDTFSPSDFPSNCTLVVEKVQLHHKLAAWKWQQFTLPALIKKYALAMLVTIDDTSFQHHKTINKHILSKAMPVKELAALHQPSIAVTSGQVLEIMKYNYPLFDGIVEDDLRPLSYEEKETVTGKYTEGKDYFVNADMEMPVPAFLNLLKAFSIFKKKQQSSWKLVFAMRTPDIAVYEKALQQYKYRADVLLHQVQDTRELNELIGASYCLITVDEARANIPVNEAFKCAVPVIATPVSGNAAYYGEDIVVTDSSGFEAIAEKIIYLYKDENLGNGFAGKSKQRAATLHTEAVLSSLVNWILS